MNENDAITQEFGPAYSEEELQQIDVWNKGRALQTTLVTPGWEVIKEILTTYYTSAAEELLKLRPGQDKEILAQHSVTFTAQDLVTKFMAKVNDLVEGAKEVPSALRRKKV